MCATAYDDDHICKEHDVGLITPTVAAAVGPKTEGLASPGSIDLCWQTPASGDTDSPMVSCPARHAGPTLESSERLLEEVRNFRAAMSQDQSAFSKDAAHSPTSAGTSGRVSLACQSTMSANPSTDDEDAESEVIEFNLHETPEDVALHEKQGCAQSFSEPRNVGQPGSSAMPLVPPLPGLGSVVVKSESGTCLSGRPNAQDAPPAYPALQLLSAPPSKPPQAWAASPRENLAAHQVPDITNPTQAQQRVYNPPVHVIVGPAKATCALHKSGPAAAADAAAAWRGLHRSHSGARARSSGAGRTTTPARQNTVAEIWELIHSSESRPAPAPPPEELSYQPGKMFPGRSSSARKSSPSVTASCNRPQDQSPAEIRQSSRGSAMRAARELRTTSRDGLQGNSVQSSSSRAGSCHNVPAKLRPSRPGSAAAELAATYRAPPRSSSKGPSRSNSQSQDFGAACGLSTNMAAHCGPRCMPPDSSPKSGSGVAACRNRARTAGWSSAGPSTPSASPKFSSSQPSYPTEDSNCSPEDSHCDERRQRDQAFLLQSSMMTAPPPRAPRMRLGSAIASTVLAAEACHSRRPRPSSAQGRRR